MGNWNVTIRGAGQHHNGYPRDVEKLVAEFVDKLRRNGHTVTAAVVTTGSEVDCTLGVNPAATLYGPGSANNPSNAPAVPDGPPGYVKPKSDGKIYGDAGS